MQGKFWWQCPKCLQEGAAIHPYHLQCKSVAQQNLSPRSSRCAGSFAMRLGRGHRRPSQQCCGLQPPRGQPSCPYTARKAFQKVFSTLPMHALSSSFYSYKKRTIGENREIDRAIINALRSQDSNPVRLRSPERFSFSATFRQYVFLREDSMQSAKSAKKLKRCS